MIHVTQGHEKGIGLETFLKSLVYLSESECKKITLHACRKTLELHKGILPFKLEIGSKNLTVAESKIRLVLVGDRDLQSTATLESALNLIQNNDTLFTLPTSKDQLTFKGKQTLGYTEYLRRKFNNDFLVMSFSSRNENVCLLTDHIPLVKVSNVLSKEYILKKSENIFKSASHKSHFFFCGINPHAGENGLLGSEDATLQDAVKELIEIYPKLKIHPDVIPADTHHFHKKKDSVFIFTAHDQALTSFKSNNGILAANITLGLPFRRLSVDHGVAFSIFGKNLADSTGCYFCLKQCLKWERNG